MRLSATAVAASVLAPAALALPFPMAPLEYDHSLAPRWFVRRPQYKSLPDEDPATGAGPPSQVQREASATTREQSPSDSSLRGTSRSARLTQETHEQSSYFVPRQKQSEGRTGGFDPTFGGKIHIGTLGEDAERLRLMQEGYERSSYFVPRPKQNEGSSPRAHGEPDGRAVPLEGSKSEESARARKSDLTMTAETDRKKRTEETPARGLPPPPNTRLLQAYYQTDHSEGFDGIVGGSATGTSRTHTGGQHGQSSGAQDPDPPPPHQP